MQFSQYASILGGSMIAALIFANVAPEGSNVHKTSHQTTPLHQHHATISDKETSDLIAFYQKYRQWKPVAASNDLQNNSNTFTFMSYNILADGRYANSHGYCDSKYLDWDYRWKRIFSQIGAYKPDIIAMQEPTLNMYNESISSDLYNNFEMIGFHGQRNIDSFEDQSDALFIRKNKFNVISHRIIRFKDVLNDFKNGKKTNDNNNINIFNELCKDEENKNNQNEARDKDCFNSRFWQAFEEKFDLCIMALLQSKENPKDYVIAVTTHLYWNPKYPDIKAAQAYLLNHIISHHSKEMIKEKKLENKIGNNSSIPIILGMDGNALPNLEKSDDFTLWVNSQPVLHYINEMEEKLHLDKENEMLPIYNSFNGFNSGVYEILQNGKLSNTHCDHPIGRYNIRSIFDEMLNNIGATIKDNDDDSDDISEKIRQFENDSGVTIEQVKNIVALWDTSEDKDIDNDSDKLNDNNNEIFDKEKELERLDKLVNFNWECPLQFDSVYKLADNDCKEPLYTTKVPWFQGCIDYIWINDKLEVVSVLDWANNGVQTDNDDVTPNEIEPSDHLPLVAKIKFSRD